MKVAITGPESVIPETDTRGRQGRARGATGEQRKEGQPSPSAPKKGACESSLPLG